MTGPLRKIQEQMERTVGGMEKLQKLAMTAFAGGAVIAGIKLMSSALGGLIGVMGSGLGIAKDFLGHVIEMARFRTQNILSLDLFLGKGKGEHAFGKALKIGAMLPMDEREVVRQVTTLAAAGYKGKELDAVNAALADVFATRGEAYRANLEFHFTRLKNEAKPDARDVKMAAIDTGIGMEGVFKHLFAQKGHALPGTLFGQEKLYEEMKKDGRVNGHDVALAILAGINEKFDEGKGLGTTAKRLGLGTLSGLITNLQAAPERFLAEMKLEKFAGIKALMGFMQRLLPYFDHATDEGRQLSRVVRDITNALLEPLDKITGEDIARWFKLGLNVARELVKAIKEVWHFINKIISSPEPWTEMLRSIRPVLEEMGNIIGLGIAAGVKVGAKGLATTSEDEAKENTGAVHKDFSDAYTKFKVHFFGPGPGGTNIKIDAVHIQVPPGTTQEQAGHITEALRNSNLRTGATPAAAAAPAGG